mmetsp:Transcript_8517/g.20869  ORF Transcript_8517/g.20869 Transcript_8517/m.20869 type:complete len:212 (+) Transcript_8517:1377-2012(+)
MAHEASALGEDGVCKHLARSDPSKPINLVLVVEVLVGSGFEPVSALQQANSLVVMVFQQVGRKPEIQHESSGIALVPVYNQRVDRENVVGVAKVYKASIQKPRDEGILGVDAHLLQGLSVGPKLGVLRLAQCRRRDKVALFIPGWFADKVVGVAVRVEGSKWRDMCGSFCSSLEGDNVDGAGEEHKELIVVILNRSSRLHPLSHRSRCSRD